MSGSDVLFGDTPPEAGDALEGGELQRAYFRVRRLREDLTRRERYWASVCDALTHAYDELDVRTSELAAVRAELLVTNERLADRVEAQVQALRSHAERIERLNDHLQAKLHERSHELLLLARSLPQKELAEGTSLGPDLTVQGPLGRGGAGIVYAARSLTFGDVAVKLLARGRRHGVERLLREAFTGARVNHPAIVRTLHVDLSVNGELYLVMELVRGSSLRSVLFDRGALPLGAALRFGATIAAALAAAHGQGVIHRDVKPANLMLERSALGVRILDFGLSRLDDLPEAEDRVLEGHLVGTPLYMAPEQIRDPSSVGSEVDVYALGATLFELVTGRAPFVGPSIEAIAYAHLHDAVPRLEGVPGDVQQAIAASLAKAPGARPTAVELAMALERAADVVGAGPAGFEAGALLARPVEATVDQSSG